MPVTAVTTDTMTCDCCGIKVVANNYLLLTVAVLIGNGRTETDSGVYTFCFENNCQAHVQPIAQYMVYEAAVHHANVAGAQSPPTTASNFLHPAIEITLADDKGTVFAAATSPM